MPQQSPACRHGYTVSNGMHPNGLPCEGFTFAVPEGKTVKDLTVDEVVGQALGAASACWSNLRGAGVFDSTACKHILDATLAELHTRQQPETTNGRRQKEWADLAYEMWALLCNSANDEHSKPEQWEIARRRVQTQLNHLLDTPPFVQPYTVTLCGSSLFKQAFEQVNRELTLQGYVVLSMGLFGHTEEEPLTPELKKALDELYLRKIDMSDEVIVVSDGSWLPTKFPKSWDETRGYVDESTAREIEYAEKTGKPVRYRIVRP